MFALFAHYIQGEPDLKSRRFLDNSKSKLTVLKLTAPDPRQKFQTKTRKWTEFRILTFMSIMPNQLELNIRLFSFNKVGEF